MDCIICRYGELALKGKNRYLFESRLVSNIHDCLRRNGIESVVKKVRGRIFVFTSDINALQCLKNVFGLVSLSAAVSVDSDIEMIKSAVLGYIKKNMDKSTKTFRLSPRRADKNFPLSSQDMAVMLGSLVVKEFSLKVNLDKPDIDINIEVHDKSFIFHEFVDCYGGLPVGMGGNVACVVEERKDLLAAWLMMRRGCCIFPVSTKEFDVSFLNKYDYGSSVSLSKYVDIVSLKSFMREKSCKALVVGSVIEDLDEKKYLDVGYAVLYPIITYDKQMIEDSFRRLN